MKPILEDPTARVRDDAFTQIANGYTLRTHQFRYTRWNIEDPDNRELYNRLKDPEEMINLAQDPNYQAFLTTLDRRLNERIAEATAPLNGLAFTAPKPGDNGIQKTYD